MEGEPKAEPDTPPDDGKDDAPPDDADDNKSGKSVEKPKVENHGQELWVWDPKAEGAKIKLVADIVDGAGSSRPGYLHAWKGAVYFSAVTKDAHYDGVWEPTPMEPASPVMEPAPPSVKSVDAPKKAADHEVSYSMFSLTENADGTFAVAEVRDSHSSTPPFENPGYYFGWGDSLYFSAFTASEGDELWSYKPAEGGRFSIIDDINPGPHGSYPRFFFTHVAKGPDLKDRELLFFGATKGDDPRLEGAKEMLQ